MMVGIRELREAAGITQVELARRSGIAQPNVTAYESGRRRPSAAMLARLEASLRPRPSELLAQRRDEVIGVLARHGLLRPRVFGSVARDEDVPGSDVDLVVDPANGVDILDLIDAAEELERMLGVRVDIVSSRGLKVGHEIELTAVPL